MAQWIEVKVRYEKVTETGKSVKVTDPYLVDALSCTEAEARIIKEVTPYISGEFNVLAVNKTKISEVFWWGNGDKFYKVKVNYITINEKTATEKRQASFILVQASSFKEALEHFEVGMKGSMADYEIEAINETKIVDVYKYQVPEEAKSNSSAVDDMVKTVASDKNVKRAVKNFRDAVPEGMKVSISAHGADGWNVPETVIVDKTK